MLKIPKTKEIDLFWRGISHGRRDAYNHIRTFTEFVHYNTTVDLARIRLLSCLGKRQNKLQQKETPPIQLWVDEASFYFSTEGE